MSDFRKTPVEIGSFEDAIRFYTGEIEPVEAVRQARLIDEENSVWIASKLRLEVAKDESPKAHRGFALWACIPEKDKKSFWKTSEFVNLFSKETGLCRREIYRIVNANDDKFWQLNNDGKYLQFFSKERVYDIYGLEAPGVSQLVPKAGLLGNLKTLRYWLQAGIFNGREVATITRDQIQEETGFSKHQQLAFEHEVSAQKLSQYIYDEKNKDQPTKQTANRYTNLSQKRRVKRRKMYGIRAGRQSGYLGSSICDVKSFYDTQDECEAKARKLDRQNRARNLAYLSKENSSYALYFAV